ncbi:MAG TPA: Uma2 family endonuclease [Kofleriaceae bacterium]|nr:Uma2 family endonuclease [Kofleriaceae bacterium]
MSSSARRLHYTYREYLALEEESAVRHEYLDGEIYAMAGGTPDHASLAAAVSGVLRPALPPGCRTFSADLRIRITATGLSTYPDVSVVCGRTQRADDDPLAVTNPVLLVEVTSPSTEDYDRGEKLRHYKLIPSVREIMIVSHRGPRITVHRRIDGDQWSMHELGRGEIVELISIAGQVRVDDVYRDALEDAGPSW